MQLVSGLRLIADTYDAILCDVWGVIHNGRAAFEPACEALVAFRAAGGRVLLITNAPVPKAQVLRYFAPLGVPDDAFDDCISSGDATRALLEQHQGQSIWRLGADEGWEHDRFLYEGLDLEFVDDPDTADLGLLIGLRDQGADHPEAYRTELAALAKTRLTLVCANPDIQVRIGDKLHWCAGALAQIYEEEGGLVTYPGKPHATIYDLAFQRLRALGASGDPDRTLAIGDSAKTDIMVAEAQGIDRLYVGTGLTSHSADASRFEGEVRKLLEKDSVSATYAQPFLQW